MRPASRCIATSSIAPGYPSIRHSAILTPAETLSPSSISSLNMRVGSMIFRSQSRRRSRGAMFSLPVSSVAIDVRLPAGTDELALLETHTADPALAAMLLARLGTCEEPIDWTALPVPDVEAALLRIRQIAIGDLVRTDVRCVSVDCRARVDVAFRISEYLA